MLKPPQGEKSAVSQDVEPEYTLVITCPDDLLEESVVYQDIFQKGVQIGLLKSERRGFRKGWKRGLELGKKAIALRMLTAKVGKLPLKLRRQIEGLPLKQVEALLPALPDFKTRDDLIRWLAKHVQAN